MVGCSCQLLPMGFQEQLPLVFLEKWGNMWFFGEDAGVGYSHSWLYFWRRQNPRFPSAFVENHRPLTRPFGVSGFKTRGSCAALLGGPWGELTDEKDKMGPFEKGPFCWENEKLLVTYFCGRKRVSDVFTWMLKNVEIQGEKKNFWTPKKAQYDFFQFQILRIPEFSADQCSCLSFFHMICLLFRIQCFSAADGGFTKYVFVGKDMSTNQLFDLIHLDFTFMVESKHHWTYCTILYLYRNGTP